MEDLSAFDAASDHVVQQPVQVQTSLSQHSTLPYLDALDTVKRNSKQCKNVSRQMPQARRAFSQIAVRRLGYAGAEVARYLGVTTSCVHREAGKAEWEPLARTVFDRAR